jgi:hypothetical protein
MPDLTGDDYAELADSYEAEPPRRDELIGEPVLNPRPDRVLDAATGEEYDPSAVPGEPPVG